ncbi:soluble scavenger receptor cysteine-rich domain-containing protein SSC5D-like, partial [Actinia tenebrosa]|uniref:Soluble scavenger receptor cysteine-rich domain-containing protein SSC5D-like n=1 Tax=Actinia tenebrosa TaxID=6105 RepID=A0A6P8HSP4_ACTTE
MSDTKVACRQLGFTKAVGPSYEGRGTVCRTNWDMPDANVGYHQFGFARAVGASYEGRGTGKVWLYNMQCTGSETALGSCPHNGWGNVMWSCITMVNGERYVKVYHQGQWGKVCSDGWYMEEAKVACRQLGFTKAVGASYNGRGTGRVWLNYMGCTGSESDLGSCSHNGWGHGWGCDRTTNVGVVLHLAAILTSFVEVYHQGQWGTVCNYGWNMPDAKVACRQLGFTKAIGASYLGRGTEVYHQGQWGTVCHGSWGMDDAKVACRQLGFTKTVGASWLGRGT